MLASINVGDTIEGVVAHNERVVNDPRVHFTIVQGDEPSPVSKCDADGFKMVERSVRQVYEFAGPACCARVILLRAPHVRKFVRYVTYHVFVGVARVCGGACVDGGSN